MRNATTDGGQVSRLERCINVVPYKSGAHLRDPIIVSKGHAIQFMQIDSHASFNIGSPSERRMASALDGERAIRDTGDKHGHRDIAGTCRLEDA